MLEGVLHGGTAGGREIDLLDDLRPGIRPRPVWQRQRDQRGSG
jgi:hypothetical protein